MTGLTRRCPGEGGVIEFCRDRFDGPGGFGGTKQTAIHPHGRAGIRTSNQRMPFVARNVHEPDQWQPVNRMVSPAVTV